MHQKSMYQDEGISKLVAMKYWNYSNQHGAEQPYNPDEEKVLDIVDFTEVKLSGERIKSEKASKTNDK